MNKEYGNHKSEGQANPIKNWPLALKSLPKFMRRIVVNGFEENSLGF